MKAYYETYTKIDLQMDNTELMPFVDNNVNLTLNLLLVRYIGLFAIILSTVVSYIVVTIPWLIYNLFTVIFKMSAKDFIKKFIKYIIILFQIIIDTV